MGNIKVNTSLQWFFAIAMSLLLIGSFTWMAPADVNVPEFPEPLTADQTRAIIQIELASLGSPASAEDIASNIVIPKSENAQNGLLNDFLENHFEEEYDELEDAVYNAVMEELEDNDYELFVDLFEDKFDNFDEFTSVNEDDDETEFTVVSLGLDDDDDKEAMVYLEFKVKYKLTDGEATKYKDTIYVNANVLFDEGIYSDEEVSITLSL